MRCLVVYGAGVLILFMQACRGTAAGAEMGPYNTRDAMQCQAT